VSAILWESSDHPEVLDKQRLTSFTGGPFGALFVLFCAFVFSTLECIRIIFHRVATMSNNNQTAPTIFVQIASYRDVECQHTVKDLFEKATHPGRIFVGICWQCDPEEDSSCFVVEPPAPNNVRISKHHWRDSEGVCWARHKAQQLYAGEDYVLMIDSHMRFVESWDTLLIKELAACNSEKPLISCYPASYTPPDVLQTDTKPTVMRVKSFTPNGGLRCNGVMLGYEPERPLKGVFVAAGFIFARGDVIKEVPYDPFIYFNEEEVLFSVKLYTHGWDVFSARRQYLYHYYREGGDDDDVRHLHWKDNKEWVKFETRSIARRDHLLNIAPTEDMGILQDVELYSLGKKRSVSEFECYGGLNFKVRLVNDDAPYWLDIKRLEEQQLKAHIDNAIKTA